MRSLLIAGLAALVLVLGACGGSGDNTTSTAAKQPKPSPCKTVPKAKAKKVKLKRPALKAPAPGTRAVFDTNCGSFTITLDGKRHPKTAASMAYQVQRGVYDGTSFFRIAPGFVIQGGDPSGTGRGDAGYTVIEAPGDRTAYTKGVVAMAKSAVQPPGASGSQFFVVSGADAGLPPDYAVAGKVTNGFDTVSAISSLSTSSDGPPSQPIVIAKAKLLKG